ncbi:MAG: caspase family protein, partial [Gemmatimonadetes bacterium]|nr:caspase family protein [Gemmatimonadota bacterium]
MKAPRLLLFAAVALFAGFGPHDRTAPNRWALLVGISDYINYGDEIGGDLPGAVNDALAMRDVLVKRYGFEEDHIKLLLDADADRSGIQAGLTRWLPSVARPGDLVVFFFAGHGSQKWDTNGDEADGLDETICPADVLRRNADRDIADDELNIWLNDMPTDNIVVILDSCHSGTGTRAITPFARPRSLKRNPTSDLAKPAGAKAATPGVRETANLDASTRKPIVEIAAAQPDEVAMDAVFPGVGGAPSKNGGAFTTNFVRNLWQAPDNASYQEVFEFTRRDLKRQ